MLSNKIDTFINHATGESVSVEVKPILPQENKKYKYKKDGWAMIYPHRYDEVVAELNGKAKIGIFAFLREMAKFDVDTKMFKFQMPSQAVIASDTGVTQPQVSSTIKIMKKTGFIIVEDKIAYVNPFIFMSGIRSVDQLPCQDAWRKKFIRE